MASSSARAECTNPECNFRFPLPSNLRKSIDFCPKCKSPIRVQEQADSDKEMNLRIEKNNRPPLYVLLDNIRSTYNVGSIFRSADGAGVDKIYVCGVSPSPDHPRIAKTALGAEYSVDWEYCPNALVTAKMLSERGCILSALEVGSGAVPVFNADFPVLNKTNVLVIGNEISGIDSEILPLCSYKLWIPMAGYKRSLNVACAFSIAVYILQYSLKPVQRI